MASPINNRSSSPDFLYALERPATPAPRIASSTSTVQGSQQPLPPSARRLSHRQPLSINASKVNLKEFQTSLHTIREAQASQKKEREAFNKFAFETGHAFMEFPDYTPVVSELHLDAFDAMLTALKQHLQNHPDIPLEYRPSVSSSEFPYTLSLPVPFGQTKERAGTGTARFSGLGQLGVLEFASDATKTITFNKESITSLAPPAQGPVDNAGEQLHASDSGLRTGAGPGLDKGKQREATAEREATPAVDIQRGEMTSALKRGHDDYSSPLNSESEADDAPLGKAKRPRVDSELGNAMQFELPESMKLHPDIRAVLDEMENEARSAAAHDENQGTPPNLVALTYRLKESKFGSLGGSNLRTLIARGKNFDQYCKSKNIGLQAALADVPTFHRLARASLPKNSGYTNVFNSYINVFYPDSPARQKIRELLNALPSLQNAARSIETQAKYLTAGTAIDLHLAQQGLQFADICPVDSDGNNAVNQERAQRFITIKNELLSNASHDSIRINILRILRTHLHPLPEDDALGYLINNAILLNGEPVADSNKSLWQLMAVELAEILRKENIPVIAFVNALIGVPGVDAVTRFANFKKLEQPFNDSKLNYKELKNRLGDAFEKLAKNVIFVPPSKETLAMLASFK